MKKLKKWLILSLLVFSLGACSGQQDKPTQDTTKQSEKEQKDKQDQSKDQNKDQSKDQKTSEQAFVGKEIVNAQYVKEHLNDPNIIFVDARGEKNAKSGTLKNAVVMSWQQIANTENIKPGQENWGHILSPEVLSQKLGALGLDKNKEIVLFSTAGKGWGEDGRIMWELQAAGYQNLKMVDGGIQAIKAAGVELTDEISKPTPVEVKIDKIDYKNTINTAELTKDKSQYKIVDSREKDEYAGATKYGEAKGGHIPGAINIPYTSLYNEKGLLKSNAEIEKMFKDAGLNKDDKIVTYCTGGIRSAYMQLIMDMVGYHNVKNYEGSYYNWAAVNEVEK